MKKKKEQPPSANKGLISVVPLGKVGPDVIRVVSDSLQGILRVPVDVEEETIIPQDAFMEGRNQYNAMTVIKFLANDRPHKSLKVLGVTQKDLCNPILTYVFGEAYMGGSAAVMSCHRLYTDQTGEPVSREQFLDRVVKVALHEIGHTFNIAHCHTDRCVMRASNSLMDLDSKLNYLCPYCELFLFDALRAALQ
ncbi:MAG: archaemetzincin family Zn-dependent metalloprotease [Desulfomonile tiedjei]|nr:archaemetzincin family Zn-dependent metalloprotease [Desulfomonile tiedjei]